MHGQPHYVVITEREKGWNMSKLLKTKVFQGGGCYVLAFSIILGLLSGGMKAAADCGCVDLVFVADDSGSMGGAQNNIKSAMPAIIAAAQAASGSNLRLGVVSFPNVAGTTNDGVTVRQAFTTDTTLINNAIQALTATGGNGEPESSDAALQYVVTGTTDTGCTISNTPLGSYRSGCTKIAAIFTDAHPGGCSDSFSNGVDDVHAALVAADAAAAGVRIASIFIPGEPDPSRTEVRHIMQNYATISGGTFTETSSDGTGAAQGILNIIIPLVTPSTNSIGTTRTSRFWFTHAFSFSDCTCVTLLKAIQLSGGTVDLGFINLPTANRNSDNVIDSNDALMEALGFNWLSSAKTGENNGLQSQKLSGSNVCKARKQLSVELIAAIANIGLFHTDPSEQTFFNGAGIVTFPADLLQQARAAATSDDAIRMRTMTALLKKFNSSGSTNNYPTGLVECDVQKNKDLKQISADPTTQGNCGGSSHACDSAEAVVFANSADPFARAIFKSSANTKFGTTNSVAAPTCFAGTGGAGPDAVWQIKPTTVGTSGRQFTVSTSGSNFDTLISVWSGDTCSNLIQLACMNSFVGVGGEQLSFNTDGTNTYRIVVEGAKGGFGSIKVKISSP
jgi:hypothetical protein